MTLKLKLLNLFIIDLTINWMKNSES